MDSDNNRAWGSAADPKGTGLKQAWLRRGLGAVLILSLVLGCRPKMGEEVAALVNGRPIRMETLRRACRAWSEQPRSAAQEARVRSSLLEQLIEEELMVQRAEELGLEVTEAELGRKIEEIKADYAGGGFEEMLVREYIDFEQWKEKLRRNLLIGKVIEAEVKSRLGADSGEWESFFEAHRAETHLPTRVKVRHLTWASRAEAERARKKLKAGQDFGRVAREHLGGEAAAAEEPGRWVNPDRLPEKMAQAILATAPGGVSRPVETESGYSLFQVLEIRPAGPMPPEEAIAWLRQRFALERESRALAQWIKGLKAEAEIEINPALVTSLAKSEPGEAAKR